MGRLTPGRWFLRTPVQKREEQGERKTKGTISLREGKESTERGFSLGSAL